MIGRYLGLAASLCGIMLLSGAAHAQSDDWQAVITAAKKEGKVLIYGSLSDDDIQHIRDDFGKKYGITVEANRLLSDPMMQRITAEVSSGTVLVDVLIPGEQLSGERLNAQNLLAKVTGPDLDKYPAKGKRLDSKIIDVRLNAWTILYNTDTVKGDDIPKQWTDIFKPRWKDHVALVTATTGVSSSNFYQFLTKNYGGDDALQKIGALNPRIVQSGSLGGPLVTSGEVDIAFPMSSFLSYVQLAKKAPVKAVFAVPSPVYAQSASIMAKAPHPNASRLLVNWMASPEGQASLNGGFAGGSLLPNIPGTIEIPANTVFIESSEVNDAFPHLMELWNKYIAR